MASFTVPPGGLAGFSQMTPASRRALFPGQRSRGSSRRTRRTAVARAASSKPRRSKRSGKSKMKFGSPAWQKKYKVGRFAKKR